jgi:hypothetical protein
MCTFCFRVRAQHAEKLAELINSFHGLRVTREERVFVFEWRVFSGDGHIWQSLGGLAAGGNRYNDPNGHSLRDHWGLVQFGRSDFRVSRLVEGYRLTQTSMEAYGDSYRQQFGRYILKITHAHTNKTTNHSTRNLIHLGTRPVKTK